MIRRAKDITTMTMIVVCWLMAAMTAYWTTDYLNSPIEIVNNSAVFDVAHSRMRLTTKFIFNRRCDGTLRIWLRSTEPEPPPRAWTELGPVDLPPSGFSGSPPVRGKSVERTVDVSLNGFMPPSEGFYMAEREFTCNPLQHLLPLTVKSPVTEYRLDAAN